MNKNLPSDFFNLSSVDPRQPNIRQLISQLDEFQAPLYPPESNHLDDVEVLSQKNVFFVAAFFGGHAIGIGAVKIMDGYGEIKRMFVLPEYRGQGVADLVYDSLEEQLRKSNVTIAKLETGHKQAAAISFYKRKGFVECEAFDLYKPDPLSVFMEKKIPQNPL